MFLDKEISIYDRIYCLKEKSIKTRDIQQSNIDLICVKHVQYYRLIEL